MAKPPTETGSAQGKIAERRSRRLIGRTMRGDGAGPADVLEGPELVGVITEIPQRSSRADPIRSALMDAAELLFARWGYTGVSIRDVTDLAGRRLADVTYYFGSKQNLYFEVLKRRAEPLGEARIAALERCERLELRDQDYVGAWVDAYLDPPLRLLAREEPGWNHYFRMIAQVAYSRLWPDTFSTFYNNVAARFMSALAARFPDATPACVQHCFLMLTATTMYTLARTGRVETFADPAFGSEDLHLLGPMTRDFVMLGIGGMLKSAPDAKRHEDC